MSNFILAGRIIGLHGLKGFLKLESFLDNPRDIFNFNLIDQDNSNIAIKYQGPLTQKIFFISVSGVNSRKEADSFKGRDIFILKEDLPSLTDDEFYYSDVIGLTVFDENNKEYGNIVGIKNYGAGPFIEIQHHGMKKINAFFHQEAILQIAENKVVLKSNFILTF